MYLRRLRTVMDEFLHPPGTSYGGLFIENHIDEMAAVMRRMLTSTIANGRTRGPGAGRRAIRGTSRSRTQSAC